MKSDAEYSRDWRKRHPEQARQYLKRWRDANPDKVREQNHRAYERRKALRQEQQKGEGAGSGEQ